MTQIAQIATSCILPWDLNPRQVDNPKAQLALDESVAQHGILTALLIRPLPPRDGIAHPTDRYEVICGHRRLLAAQACQLDSLPCQIRDLDDEQALELSLIENIARASLHPLSEAIAMQTMLASHKDIADLAQKLSQPQAWIRTRFRLLGLSPTSRQYWTTHEIPSIDHALAWAATSHNDQLALTPSLSLPLSQLRKLCKACERSLTDSCFASYYGDPSMPGKACSACVKHSEAHPCLPGLEVPSSARLDLCFDAKCWRENELEACTRIAQEAKAKLVSTTESPDLDLAHPRSAWKAKDEGTLRGVPIDGVEIGELIGIVMVSVTPDEEPASACDSYQPGDCAGCGMPADEHFGAADKGPQTGTSNEAISVNVRVSVPGPCHQFAEVDPVAHPRGRKAGECSTCGYVKSEHEAHKLAADVEATTASACHEFKGDGENCSECGRAKGIHIYTLMDDHPTRAVYKGREYDIIAIIPPGNNFNQKENSIFYLDSDRPPSSYKEWKKIRKDATRDHVSYMLNVDGYCRWPLSKYVEALPQ